MGFRASDPAHVLHEVNHSLMPIIEHTGQPVFATVFFGVIDTRAWSLTYGNAGHPAPLVLRAKSENIARLAPADPEPAAGLLGDFVYSRHECEFSPGDLFFGYTDGVLEASDGNGGMFGEDRLRDVLTANRGRSGAEVSDRLLREMQTYSGSAVFEDDVCLVAIEAK
jgi:sigma-B regulation protein RsbU (phosphoserine phosphatase)